jgi:excisionase family DNA binding protein
VKPLASNDLIAPVEAAELLSVDPKTVGRWASAGKINAIRTPGGHRRFLRSEILAMIAVDGAGGTPPRVDGASLASIGEHDGRPRDDQEESDRWAAFSIAEAVMLAARTEAEEAAVDVIRTAAAVTAAADTAAAAAQRARAARAQAVKDVAEAVAAGAARTAVEVKLRADATARSLHQSATDAEASVLNTQQVGGVRDATHALELAASAVEAAVAAAEESALAAAEVARAVAAAAADVAMRVSAFDTSVELEVARVAAALQVTATAQAREKAADTETRARAKAVVAREAARAVRRRAIDRERPREWSDVPVPSPGYAMVPNPSSERR